MDLAIKRKENNRRRNVKTCIRTIYPKRTGMAISPVSNYPRNTYPKTPRRKGPQYNGRSFLILTRGIHLAIMPLKGQRSQTN